MALPTTSGVDATQIAEAHRRARSLQHMLRTLATRPEHWDTAVFIGLSELAGVLALQLALVDRNLSIVRDAA